MAVDHLPMCRMLRLGAVVAGIVCAGGFAFEAHADDTVKALRDSPAAAFFSRHCQVCHSGAKPKGNFALENLTQDFEQRTNRLRWLAVLEQLAEGNMPPAGKPRPEDSEIKAVTE